MKKLMIAMACVVMSAGAALNAQNCKPADCKKACPAEKCTPALCDSTRACRPAFCEFQDLNLTDAQKEQIKALKEQNRAERMAKAKDKADRKAAKKDARRQFRQDYLAKVKAILTPEQYIQYLENNFVNGGNKAMAKPGKPGKHGHHGQRPDMRGQRPAPQK